MAEKPNPIFNLLRIPTMVVGAIAALGIVLSALGFEVRTPGKSMDEHLAIEHRKLNNTIQMLTDSYNERTDLMRALVVGYCIEHDKETLDRARLTATCKKEGIEK